MYRIINNHFNSPFFIFIKGIHHFEDEVILRKLGFNDAFLVTQQEFPDEKKYVFIARNERWVHIMDNTGYGLWHMCHSPEIQADLNGLIKEFDIFQCSIGDIDYSFNFRYYKDGQLVRQFELEAPFFSREKTKVKTNFGPPLPHEDECLKNEDELDKVLSPASSLGINTKHELSQIKCYQVLPVRLKF